MPEPIKYITTCTLPKKDGTPCAQQLADFAFEIPVIGEAPSTRTIRFMQALGKHTASKHSREHQEIMAHGIHYSGFLTARTYHTEDPGLLAAMDAVRHHTHLLTLRNYVEDPFIESEVAKRATTINGEPATILASEAIKLMKALRDFQTETGQARPDQKQPGMLVSA